MTHSLVVVASCGRPSMFVLLLFFGCSAVSEFAPITPFATPVQVILTDSVHFLLDGSRNSSWSFGTCTLRVTETTIITKRTFVVLEIATYFVFVAVFLLRAVLAHEEGIHALVVVLLSLPLVSTLLFQLQRQPSASHHRGQKPQSNQYRSKKGCPKGAT